ncbi:hypothetical protein PHISP_03314 [Aspergillus sp. HF37]|nr:hypothetical protein PHISP_03314 [Aspergillus sp. HF37]
MTPTITSARIGLRHLPHGLSTARPSPGSRVLRPNQTRLLSTSDAVPRIAQSSFWNSLVPKFLRNRPSKQHSAAGPASKEWNPASYYIIIFILIGSQAIRMLALKHDFSAYTRSTDAKISLLREVIEKVQRGEEVDVRKMLGTGDEAKEREWEEVLQDLEKGNSIWHKEGSASKSGEQQPQQEQTPPTEDSRAKDPAVPAEGNAQDQSQFQSQGGGEAAQKSNFF